ncbi:hypothetical protein F2Q70_00034395 [Brassica cretica]|uniref:Uncharacterized protein n=1 Tax=Brassica cretica TaxID=69181 RepID=A0A8S9JTX8_BRACR|nr:hypothetical protein F2Q70_00034395 [Brassica cretica]
MALLNITGPSGTQVLDIPRYATVSEAASGGQWNILRCRGYHLWAMIACINSVPAPAEDAVADRRLWRHGDEDYKPTFSSKATWEQLRVHNPKLPWIDCQHEREVELGVACNRVSSVVNRTKLVTTCFSLALTHLQREIDICILKLALQASIHSIWRERNSRRHQGTLLSAGQMVRYIDKTIRNMISSL